MIDSPYEHHHHLPPPWHGDKSRQFSEMAGQSARQAEESESNAKEAADSAEESRQRAKAYMHYAAHAMLDAKKELSKLDGYDFDAILERLEDVEKKANAAALAASKSFEDVARANIEIRNFVEQTKKEIEDAVDASSKHAGDASDSADSAADSAKEAADVAELTTFREFLSQTRLAAEQSATSASAASDSKEDAAESAEQARQYAESVTTAETSALDAAENAKTSAQQAAASAAAFAQYTARAETAATKAETAQEKAEDAQSAAETAQSNAETAYSNANTAAQEAGRQQGLAQGYAQAAATSATNAANAAATAAANAANAVADELSDYADRAETAAGNAQTYRNQAEGFSSAASTSAEQALKSESNSLVSATNAQTSATNALVSETNAANSATAAASSADGAARSATAAQQSFDDLFVYASPVIDKSVEHGHTLLITDGAPLKIESLTAQIRTKYNDGNPVEAILANFNGTSLATIMPKPVRIGFFDFLTGKLFLQSGFCVLDGVNAGAKIARMQPDLTPVVHNFVFDTPANYRAGEGECSIEGQPDVRLEDFFNPGVLVKDQPVVAGDTVRLTMFHGNGNYKVNAVTGFGYTRADTGADVLLRINSTNFKTLEIEDDYTTGTIKLFELCFNALDWWIEFDNGLVNAHLNPRTKGYYFANGTPLTTMCCVSNPLTDQIVVGYAPGLEEFSNVENLNTFLAEKATAGEPLYLNYPSSASKEYTLTPRELYTVKGDNTLAAQNVKLNISYHADPTLLQQRIIQTIRQYVTDI